MPKYVLPNHVFEHVRGGFVQHTAREILEKRERFGMEVLHPGHAFGAVLAWAWKESPDLATAIVTDLLAHVRYHSPGADATITLQDLLDGVDFSIHDMVTKEAEALIEHIRAGVPGHVDADVASRPRQS